MTIRGAIRVIDADYPNTFDEERKTSWISRCEKQIISEIMLLNPADYDNYHWAYDADRELAMPEPYAQLYTLYVIAQMHLAYHEADNYQNTMQLFNRVWTECCGWYADTYRPAELEPFLRARPVPIETWMQGETIAIDFMLPYDAEDVQAITMTLVSYDAEIVKTLADMDVEGMTARVTLDAETTASMPTGIWRGVVMITGTDGVTTQSTEAYTMRIVDVRLGLM